MNHAARSAFADEAGIDSIVNYLWAIRAGYGTARPAEMAGMLMRAAADHGSDAVNLRRIGSQRSSLKKPVAMESSLRVGRRLGRFYT